MKKVIVAIAVALTTVACLGDSTPRNADGSLKTERQIKLEKTFDAWDGSHIKLTKLIKSNMIDPSSYEHVETLYRDDKNSIFVRTKYRGKNAFGGKVTNTVEANVSIRGNVIDVISQY